MPSIYFFSLHSGCCEDNATQLKGADKCVLCCVDPTNSFKTQFQTSVHLSMVARSCSCTLMLCCCVYVHLFVDAFWSKHTYSIENSKFEKGCEKVLLPARVTFPSVPLNPKELVIHFGSLQELLECRKAIVKALQVDWRTSPSWS